MDAPNPNPALAAGAGSPSVLGVVSGRKGSDALMLVFLGVLPFGLLLDAGFIGQIFATELIFFLLLPLLWLTGSEPLPAASRNLIKWIVLWLAVQVATDIYVGSFIGDYLRGWAKLIFFMVDVYVLSKLLSTEKRLLFWLLGWNTAYAISSWLQFEDLAVRWKFGVGFCAVNAIAILALLAWPQRLVVVARLGALVCLGAGIASLFLNARNTFLCLSFASLLLFMTSFRGLRSLLTKTWDRRGVLLLAGVLGTAYLTGVVYVQGASSGLFGDDAREKLKAQANDAFGPVLGALAGGRSEFNASFAAIGDSPIIGYGSWARSAYYYNVFVESVHETGTPEQIKEIDSMTYVGDPLIPTHSHLFGAWVEAGIVGAAFWVIVLRRVLRLTRRALDLASPVAILVMLNTAFFFWNIVFSPFGGEMRLVNASLLALFFFTPAADPQADASPGAAPAQPAAAAGG